MVFVVLKTDGGLICSLVATPLMCVRKTCSISKGSLDLELCYVYGSVNNGTGGHTAPGTQVSLPHIECNAQNVTVEMSLIHNILPLLIYPKLIKDAPCLNGIPPPFVK